jgi:pantoate--beta-alanine ligase
MGALHAGHISLVEQCCRNNEHCLVSIFVNPTQFNNAHDLDKYPVTIEKDIEMLVAAGVSVLFLPSVKEIYPDEASRRMQYDLGYLGTILEASARPGHFDGVALIVKRLLEIVEPHQLYMGQKDYQQFMVVKKLITDFALQVELVMCPIMREPDGLAMSSRNVRLDAPARQAALDLSRSLNYVRENAAGKSINELKNEIIDILNLNKAIHVEYFEIREADTLKPIDSLEDKPAVALLAATVGGVHLLDNTII